MAVNRDDALLIAMEAVDHPKVGTVKLVEELSPTPGAFVLVGLRHPFAVRTDGALRTTFTLATEFQWHELKATLR